MSVTEIDKKTGAPVFLFFGRVLTGFRIVSGSLIAFNQSLGTNDQNE